MHDLFWQLWNEEKDFDEKMKLIEAKVKKELKDFTYWEADSVIKTMKSKIAEQKNENIAQEIQTEEYHQTIA